MIQYVIKDKETGEYRQLAAMLVKETGTYLVAEYDTDYNLVNQEITNYGRSVEMDAWIKRNKNIVKGLLVHVFKNPFGDCTNNGISSTRETLYIIGDDVHGVWAEPNDIRECVTLERKQLTDGTEHITAKPIYRKGSWHMNGGNFIYSCDSRYKEITGIHYPIPILDRVE